MKKAQKEQIKQDGQVARALYCEFLRKPEWAAGISGLSPSVRRVAIEALEEIRDMYITMADTADEEYKMIEQTKKDAADPVKVDTMEQKSLEAFTRSARYTQKMGAIHLLVMILRPYNSFLTVADEKAETQEEAIADFVSRYRRDN